MSLSRRTPMPRGKPLQPGAPLTTTAPLRRTAPLERVSSPQRGAQLPQRPKPQTPEERDARDALATRSGGLCEARLPGCYGVASDYQHRKRRPHCTREEYWATSNALACCRCCHDYIGSAEGRPLARARGWHLDSWAQPTTTPVRIAGRDWLLDDHGGMRLYQPKEGKGR